MSSPLKAPFPYFGGKSRAAPEVWRRFGITDNYVEPFFGSGAMLLARPDFNPIDPPMELVNDADGMVANFWRAVTADPEGVAKYADWPINENDLHARHAWLVGQRKSMTNRLEGSPTWYDAQAAGWWVWGISSWIGGGFCSGDGPWIVRNGELIDSRDDPNAAAGPVGQSRRRPSVSGKGRGVHRQIPIIEGGRGIHCAERLTQTFNLLAIRLRRVRVCCGDFERVLSKSCTTINGCTAIFLDPPYDTEAANRDGSLYAVDGDGSVAHRARNWAIANGDNELLRIALCGYREEHAMPESWATYSWKAHGGYANIGDNRGKANKHRETIWFSPHCVVPTNDLFDSR